MVVYVQDTSYVDGAVEVCTAADVDGVVLHIGRSSFSAGGHTP